MNYKSIYKLILIFFTVLLFFDIKFKFLSFEDNKLIFHFILLINFIYIIRINKEKKTQT
jgi:hypothetical protein